MLIAVGQLPDAHGHVDALLHHADHTIHQQRIDRDIGELRQKIHHQWRDKQLTKQYRCGNRQLPTGLGVTARRRVLGFLHLGENSPTIFKITLARLAQMNAARGAREQLRTNTLLQRRDRARDTGGRHAQTPRGRRKPLILCDCGEDLHFLEAVHEHVLDSDKKIATIGCDFSKGGGLQHSLSQRAPRTLANSHLGGAPRMFR